nr:hypothetical protein [Tanacetum cinerariifolium]
MAALDRLISNIGHVSFNNAPDSWSWKISNDDSFSVQATRSHIDNCLLPSLHPNTRWLKFLPHKVNIFIWRLILDRLPTCLNLSLRGIDIPSIACTTCNTAMETNEHVFFECDTASNIWRLVSLWSTSNMPSFSSSIDWLQWFDNRRATKSSKDRIYAIFAATLWILWRYRNNVIFSDHPIRKSNIFDHI